MDETDKNVIATLKNQKIPFYSSLSPEERADEIGKEMCERLKNINIDSEFESAALINFLYENIEHNDVEELIVFGVVQLFLQTAELADDCKFYFLRLINAIFQFDPTNRFLSVFCRNKDTYEYIMQTLLVMFSDKPDDLSSAILALHLWIETPEYQDCLTPEFRNYVSSILPLYEEMLSSLTEQREQSKTSGDPDSKRDPYEGRRSWQQADRYSLGTNLVKCKMCGTLLHSNSLAAHESEHVLRERRDKTGGVYCRAWNLSATQWITTNIPSVNKDEYIRCSLSIDGK